MSHTPTANSPSSAPLLEDMSRTWQRLQGILPRVEQALSVFEVVEPAAPRSIDAMSINYSFEFFTAVHGELINIENALDRLQHYTIRSAVAGAVRR